MKNKSLTILSLTVLLFFNLFWVRKYNQSSKELSRLKIDKVSLENEVEFWNKQMNATVNSKLSSDLNIQETQVVFSILKMRAKHVWANLFRFRHPI